MLSPILCLALVAAAPPPAAGPVPWWVPAPHRDAEFTRMLFAILDGSMMSRGEGWFGPAQSRYTWAWLAAKHNLKPTAELPEDKFRGSPELFAALDRDHDGVLRAGDFDWSDDAPFVRELAAARRWLDRADKNNDGKLSKDEWDALFKKAAAGKDHLTPDDVRKLLFPPAPPRPAAPTPGAMPSQATLLLGLLSGELGSARPGPKVGDRAPDFTLKSPDGKQTVHLADFLGKKPAVLVFGSFT
jgi:hypothetical protein